MAAQHSLSQPSGLSRALSGILFPVFFIAGDILRGRLATMPLPLPSAPAAEAARYFTESRTAVIAVGICQILAALALFVFAGSVVGITRQERGALPGLARAGGILSATLLLICGCLGLALVPIAAGGDLALVETVRTLNFLAGGTFHIASLGLFAGAGSLAARRAGALPRPIAWLGVGLAIPAILSLLSLALYPANALILLGRILGFVWSIAAGIALARSARRAPVTGGKGYTGVLAQ